MPPLLSQTPADGVNVRYAGFHRLLDYSLLNAYQWRPGFFGVVMLCPVGFHEMRIFDYRDGEKEIVCRNMCLTGGALYASM
jgi:hypothetical protein